MLPLKVAITNYDYINKVGIIFSANIYINKFISLKIRQKVPLLSSPLVAFKHIGIFKFLTDAFLYHFCFIVKMLLDIIVNLLMDNVLTWSD